MTPIVIIVLTLQNSYFKKKVRYEKNNSITHCVQFVCFRKP